MRKIVAANTVSQLVGKGLSAIATFVVTLLIARQLGASGYGDFVKITTYVAFFYLLADFGINAVYLQQAESRTSWPSLVCIRTIGGLLLIACALGIVTLLPGTRTAGYTSFVRLGILLYSPTILFQAWITTGNAVFQKRLRYDFAAWAIFFGSLVTVGLLWALLFVWQVPAVTGALLALVAGSVVTAATTIYFAFRLHPFAIPHISGADIRRLFLPSIPLGITLLFNLVYFRADSVVLTLTRPTAEVGVYGLAYKVFEVVLVFPTFFMNAVYPFMVKEQHVNLKKIFTNSFLFLLVTSLASLLILWFTAPALTLVKSDFAPSISALRVLSLGLPFFFVTSATMWVLVALKKQSALAVIYGVSMIVNIIGNILLVPIYGFMAAAWLTGISEGLVLVLSGFVLVQSFSLSKK
ncbi:MAG: flippase [Candidatus Gottesmanbacteria bacterium]|nr:flippase [Candidatus Gottesmanbacteria bacterium]